MNRLNAHGKVIDGALRITHRSDFDHDLSMFEGKEVTITVERKRKTRSLMQNAYFHLLMKLFKESLNDLGNEFTIEQVKDIVKCKFLLVDIYNKSTGEIIGQRIRGTHELTTSEFTELIENVIRWAADYFHIVLPYPNEQLQIEMA